MVDVPHSLGNRLPDPEPSGFPERASRRRAVLWQEIRAKQSQTADRPVEQVEGLEQLIANVAAEGIDGRFADGLDPDVFRDLRRAHGLGRVLCQDSLPRLTAITTFLPTMVPHSATAGLLDHTPRGFLAGPSLLRSAGLSLPSCCAIGFIIKAHRDD